MEEKSRSQNDSREGVGRRRAEEKGRNRDTEVSLIS